MKYENFLEELGKVPENKIDSDYIWKRAQVKKNLIRKRIIGLVALVSIIVGSLFVANISNIKRNNGIKESLQFSYVQDFFNVKYNEDPIVTLDDIDGFIY